MNHIIGRSRSIAKQYRMDTSHTPKWFTTMSWCWWKCEDDFGPYSLVPFPFSRHHLTTSPWTNIVINWSIRNFDLEDSRLCNFVEFSWDFFIWFHFDGHLYHLYESIRRNMIPHWHICGVLCLCPCRVFYWSHFDSIPMWSNNILCADNQIIIVVVNSSSTQSYFSLFHSLDFRFPENV